MGHFNFLFFAREAPDGRHWACCPTLTSRSRHTTHSEVWASSSAQGAEGLTASGSSSGAVGRTSPWGGFGSSVGTETLRQGHAHLTPIPGASPGPAYPKWQAAGAGWDPTRTLPSYTPSYFSLLSLIPPPVKWDSWGAG